MWGRWRKVTAALFACALSLALLAGITLLPVFPAREACASPGAGWVKQDVVSGEYAIMDMDAVSADTVWCVGPRLLFSGNVVMKTTDGGDHWQQLETGTSQGLYAVDAVDGSTAWAVGMGIIIKTSNGGSSWVPQGTTINFMLTGVSAVSEEVAWASGMEVDSSLPTVFRGVVIKTVDGGDTWQKVKSGGSGEYYYDVDALSADAAWVSVTGGTMNTTDGGGSWAYHGIAANCPFIKISCAGGGAVWTLGQVSGTGSALSAYVSTDGGGSWSGYHLPIDETLYIRGDLCGVDVNNAWVAALHNEPSGMFNIEGYVFRTTDGGGSWERLYPCGDVMPVTVCAASAGTAWVAGMGSIAKTTDGGATWTSQLPLDCDFYGVDARDGSGVIAVGSGGMSVSYAHMYNPALPEDLWLGQPLYTLESGQVDKDLRGVTVEEGSYWAVGMDGTVIKSPTPENAAASEDQSPGVPNDIYVVSSADADTAWIAGENGIMKTSNGGSDWSLQVVITQTLYAVCAVDTQTVWAAGQGGLLGKTTNGGTAWTVQVSGVTADLYGLAAVDAQTAWAVGAGGTIIKTTDGGAAWRPQVSGVTADLYGVAAVNAQTAWAVGAGGTIIKTTDGGATWRPQASGVTVALRGVAALDADNAFAVGDDATILRTEDGGGPGAELSVTSVSPKQATQLTYRINLTVAGTGFQPGAKVRLEKGSTVIRCFNARAVSESQITCSADILGASPGAYDVVVANPGGGEARLSAGFTITSPCGSGSGSAMLLLGLTLGMLSLGGLLRSRRRGR